MERRICGGDVTPSASRHPSKRRPPSAHTNQKQLDSTPGGIMAHIGFVSTSVLESKDGVSLHAAKNSCCKERYSLLQLQPLFPQVNSDKLRVRYGIERSRVEKYATRYHTPAVREDYCLKYVRVQKCSLCTEANQRPLQSYGCVHQGERDDNCKRLKTCQREIQQPCFSKNYRYSSSVTMVLTWKYLT